MVVCICLRSITIFTLKIKLISLNKTCHLLKKLPCKAPTPFIHRSGRRKVYQKIGDDVIAEKPVI
jgi:hypothetical protein